MASHSAPLEIDLFQQTKFFFAHQTRDNSSKQSCSMRYARYQKALVVTSKSAVAGSDARDMAGILTLAQAIPVSVRTLYELAHSLASTTRFAAAKRCVQICDRCGGLTTI